MNKVDFKNIYVGHLIHQVVLEKDVDIDRICKFFKCSEQQIEKMYKEKSLDAKIILCWSKLLQYDFFRIYSHHLILYAPPSRDSNNESKANTTIPQFRKNIYTRQLIEFVLELINTDKKTKNQIIEEYRIPKTTLYKWINKYNHRDNELI
ncbi:transposase [Chryseobacterium sp.]|uniref:transposase n=1 Tax=Chryseobacterium sp. TaxID=1871047 RepID=UPI000ECB5523|nr:transposase [Chryseobacterium sp.]HCA06133.1 transposase [Chryseobacterium sp.]